MSARHEPLHSALTFSVPDPPMRLEACVAKRFVRGLHDPSDPAEPNVEEMTSAPYITVALAFPNQKLADDGIEVTPLGNGLYRLRSTPCGGPDPNTPLFFGDTIEAMQQGPDRLELVRLVSRSRLQHWLFTVGRGFLKRPDTRDLLDRVMRAGGNWELVFGGLLYVHLPPDSDIDPDAEIATLGRDP